MINVIFAVSLIVLIVVASILIYKYTNVYDYISFMESLDLTGLPIVTFKQGNKKLNFILDTGSSLSSISTNVMNTLEYTETDHYAETVGMEGKMMKVPINKVVLKYKNKEMVGEFQAVDLDKSFSVIKEQTGVTVHGLLGAEFMQDYGYVIDFNRMIAYAKKYRKSR